MRKVFALSVLALLLSSCTLYLKPGDVSFRLRFGVELTPTIVRLEPDRGTGSTYFVGETIRFIVSTDRSGYVTLVSIDPDGSSDVLTTRFLDAGTYVFPLTGEGVQYTLAPPRGLQRVRAIFTDRPSSVSFRGTYTDDGWDRQTTFYIQRSSSRIQDVAETYFYIR